MLKVETRTECSKVHHVQLLCLVSFTIRKGLFIGQIMYMVYGGAQVRVLLVSRCMLLHVQCVACSFFLVVLYI